MRTQIIPAVEAARSLATLLQKVRHHGLSFIIQSGTEAVAKLVPVDKELALPIEELQSFLATLPALLDHEEFWSYKAEIKKIRPQFTLLDKKPWD